MKSPVLRYLAAAALSLVAALIQWSFRPFFSPIPFFLFFIVVFISSMAMGMGPGIVAAVLSTILSSALMHTDPVHLTFFGIASIALAWFSSSLQRRKLEKTQDEQELLTSIANVAPAIVWITDADKNCTYVNDQWLRFSGRTREQELGTGWLDEMHADDIPRCMPLFETAFAARQPVEIEYRQRRHDGAYRLMLSRGVPRFDQAGNFSGYIGVAFDINDLRSAERETVRLASQVEHERQRLAGLVSNVPGVVWEAWGEPDRGSQRINFISDHVTRMLGYSVEEWLSTPNFWLSIVHPDDREQAARNAHEHFRDGGASTNTFRWIAKDGRAIWCEAHSTIVHDADGKPIGMRGVTLDISARKHAEDALAFAARASEVLSSSLDYEETLRAVAALALPDLADWCTVTLLDENGVRRRVAAVHSNPDKNSLAARLLDKPSRIDAPPHVVELIASNKPFVLTMDEETIVGTAVDEEHAALIRELGTGSVLVAPIQSRDRILGTISFASVNPARYGAQDVELASMLARRVALAIDNAQLYRSALDAAAAKDEFLATISHELRTPMTATLGWVRMLMLGPLDEETTTSALKAIESATLAQAKLIDDILDVSSIVIGKFRLESAAVDLRGVVEKAAEALRPALMAKSITVSVDSTRWSGFVQGDGNRLQQVVWNLISNAAKFGRKNGRVDITVEREGDRARVVVQDDGAGIEPSFLPHVFDRFRQAEGGLTRTHGGLGLGLAIVQHLVDLHGGSVRAESEGLGKGAKFTIELPAIATADEPEVSEKPAPSGKQHPDLRMKQILLVDADAESLEEIAKMLKKCGARVTTARSATEAILALNAHHDVVVTDMSMAVTDGVTLVHQLRQANRKLPAIALQKPVDSAALTSEIATALGRR